MKEAIFEYVNKHQTVTFVELAKHIPNFRGDKQMRLAKYNCILWIDMSEAAATAIDELLDEKRIEMRPTHFLTYLHDGGALSLPLARRRYQYKKPRWLPVVFNTLDQKVTSSHRTDSKAWQHKTILA